MTRLLNSKKPEPDRNPIRLRKRLIALFMIASTIAGTIAGITNFTNNILEISNKLHIELPQLR
jgi:internalin A